MDKKKIYEQYYSSHYKNFQNKNIDVERNKKSNSLEKSLKSELNISKNSKILDIGCGYGNFSFLCKKKDFKDYTGVDISTEEIELCKKDFPNYKFEVSDVFDFLHKNKLKYDLIFISHVTEHFKIEDAMKLISLLHSSLSKGGKIINIMPNADSYFNSNATMYGDITHERIYSSLSFSQFLNSLGVKSFYHKNFYVGTNGLQRVIHLFVKNIFELLILTLGYSKKKYYTSSLITIIKKNN